MQDRYLKARVPRALYEALLARSGGDHQPPAAAGRRRPRGQPRRSDHAVPDPAIRQGDTAAIADRQRAGGVEARSGDCGAVRIARPMDHTRALRRRTDRPFDRSA